MVDETITESDIWADIDASRWHEERQAGDIDVKMIQHRYGICMSAAYRYMERMVAEGKYEWRMVHDADSHTRTRKVIRKVKA